MVLAEGGESCIELVWRIGGLIGSELSLGELIDLRHLMGLLVDFGHVMSQMHQPAWRMTWFGMRLGVLHFVLNS
jgi:hypothetical protein